MVIVTAIGWLVAGLVALLFGGDWLVRGASRLALLAGMSPLVIGLTVVAFGTSAPELAVSVAASLQGKTELALGNVVGSNLFNMFFILGLTALIVPLSVERRLIRLDVPVMVLLSIMVPIVGWDGTISRADGGLLIVLMLLYLGSLLRGSKRSPESVAVHPEEIAPMLPTGFVAGRWRKGIVSLAVIVAGLALLLFGSQAIVRGAVDLARLAGMSEMLIGLTIVAAGTSLPEVAASLVAASKGERDIAVGNVVGSNLFNVGMVLGSSAAVSSIGVPVPEAAWERDLFTFVVSALVCLPIFATGRVVSRWEGALLLAGYGLFLTTQILAAVEHPQSDGFDGAVLRLAVPVILTVLAADWLRWLLAPKPLGS